MPYWFHYNLSTEFLNILQEEGLTALPGIKEDTETCIYVRISVSQLRISWQARKKGSRCPLLV